MTLISLEMLGNVNDISFHYMTKFKERVSLAYEIFFYFPAYGKAGQNHVISFNRLKLQYGQPTKQCMMTNAVRLYF